MRKNGKSRAQRRPERPLHDRIAEGLRYVNERLGIDPTDYGPIPNDEIQKRVDERLREQDYLILPQRRSEEKMTPAWEKYAEKRRV